MVIIITGPTASGKTALSERLVVDLQGAIINADLGQFYTPLTIGTAKPAWRLLPFESHLFDWVDTPRDVSVVAFKDAVDRLVTNMQQRKVTPIIVGGSSFYIKSLFYPPREIPIVNIVDKAALEMLSSDELWQRLYDVDSERAVTIEKTDRYRLMRALSLWHSTGQKPSTLKPSFVMPYQQVLLVIVLPERDILRERIYQRALQMMHHDGWIDEVRGLLGTDWQPFVQSKKLVGYSELINWLNSGAQSATLDHVINSINIKTRQYAKRQETFLKKLSQDISRDARLVNADLQVLVVNDNYLQSVKKIIDIAKSHK